jgi:glutamate N-acetyltransferase/amino-acid N-acetyltransferase
MKEILPASTGVIGMQMRMDCWRAAAPRLTASLGQAGPMEAAQAIRTTDAFPKTAWAEIEHGDGAARVLGLAKGGGMIAPNMATLLGFIMTDAQVDVAWWRQALKSAVQDSFNRITVDSDTSTNDTILGLANGAGSFKADTEPARQALLEAVTEVCQGLAYMVVQDAEGGSKVARINVRGAASDQEAELAARAVANSPLVKTALFGQDPNWGRIVAAVGRSGASFDPDRLTLHFGRILVYREGRPVEGDLDGLLAPLMRLHDIDINISLGDGPGQSTILGADLGHEYVRINGDYRT